MNIFKAKKVEIKLLKNALNIFKLSIYDRKQILFILKHSQNVKGCMFYKVDEILERKWAGKN